MGVGHPSEIVSLPEDDSKGGPPTSANNYGTPNTDLHMSLSPNRHIRVYADSGAGDHHVSLVGLTPPVISHRRRFRVGAAVGVLAVQQLERDPDPGHLAVDLFPVGLGEHALVLPATRVSTAGEY